MNEQASLAEARPRAGEVLVPVFREDRGLTKSTMEFYGVRTLLDSNGNPKRHEYPYPTGKKFRNLDEKSFFAENLKSDELFGMDKFNRGVAQAITITEGELDAMSVFQMMGSKYPAVSLPSATPSKRMFERVRDYLDSFEKIYVSFDNDGKSDHVAAKLADMFPNRVYVVPHDKYKDANEFLTSGAAQEYKNAWWNAKKFVPDNIFNGSQDFLKIYRESQDSAYLPTGIQAFDDVALGLMQGHLTVFQAPEGIGKTEFMRLLEWSLLKNHPEVPIAICHMEETKKRSLLGLVSYALGENVTRQELVDDKAAGERVEQAIIKLTENENLYQFTIGVDDDPLDILDRIRYLAVACGCRYIFFEPIQDLGYSRMGDETLEYFLSQLSTKLARLATELNVGIVTIAHENDDGAIRDCRMIGKRASVVVKLERDKMNPDEEVRNLTSLVVIKNRPSGTTGPAGVLRFNTDTFNLEEAYV
jgi:twinkle protein